MPLTRADLATSAPSMMLVSSPELAQPSHDPSRLVARAGEISVGVGDHERPWSKAGWPRVSRGVHRVRHRVGLDQGLPAQSGARESRPAAARCAPRCGRARNASSSFLNGAKSQSDRAAGG